MFVPIEAPSGSPPTDLRPRVPLSVTPSGKLAAAWCSSVATSCNQSINWILEKEKGKKDFLVRFDLEKAKL
jgi:hypothetical protein